MRAEYDANVRVKCLLFVSHCNLNWNVPLKSGIVKFHEIYCSNFRDNNAYFGSFVWGVPKTTLNWSPACAVWCWCWEHRGTCWELGKSERQNIDNIILYCDKGWVGSRLGLNVGRTDVTCSGWWNDVSQKQPFPKICNSYKIKVLVKLSSSAACIKRHVDHSF